MPRNYLMGMRQMTLRAELLQELERLHTDVFYTEKGHFAAAENLTAVHYSLGGAAALTSAAASVSVWGDQQGAAAVLGLMAALAASLLTFLKPQAPAELHRNIGRSLGDLRVRIRQAWKVDGAADSGVLVEDLRYMIKGLTAEKYSLHKDAPNIGPVAFWRAQRKQKAGHFDYE